MGLRGEHVAAMMEPWEPSWLANWLSYTCVLVTAVSTVCSLKQLQTETIVTGTRCASSKVPGGQQMRWMVAGYTAVYGRAGQL